MSAVYTKGESRALSTATTGIGVTKAGGDVHVSFRDAIILEGASGRQVAICTVDGRTVFSGTGRDLMRIPVAPGIYIVRAGNTCVKIMAM